MKDLLALHKYLKAAARSISSGVFVRVMEDGLLFYFTHADKNYVMFCKNIESDFLNKYTDKVLFINKKELANINDNYVKPEKVKKITVTLVEEENLIIEFYFYMNTLARVKRQLDLFFVEAQEESKWIQTFFDSLEKYEYRHSFSKPDHSRLIMSAPTSPLRNYVENVLDYFSSLYVVIPHDEKQAIFYGLSNINLESKGDLQDFYINKKECAVVPYKDLFDFSVFSSDIFGGINPINIYFDLSPEGDSYNVMFNCSNSLCDMYIVQNGELPDKILVRSNT